MEDITRQQEHMNFEWKKDISRVKGGNKWDSVCLFFFRAFFIYLFTYLTVKLSEAYPQDCINELTIWNLNALVVSRMQKWIDYSNIELASSIQGYG